MKLHRRHLLGSLATVVAMGTFAVPVAGAGHQDLGAKIAHQQTSIVRPPVMPQRGLPQVSSPIDRILRQELARRLDPRLCGGLAACLRQLRQAPAPSIRIVVASGFDWGDAGIGAGGALGLALLASGATLVARSRHVSSGPEHAAGPTRP